MSTNLDALAARLDELDDAPVAQHPAVLEDVAAGVIAELDELAGAIAAHRGDR